jgi:5-methylcytosine-specific restriction endonuclease McrA
VASGFPETEVKKAWDRADSRCECRRSSHSHVGRCNKLVRWESRGKESELGWEAHHIDSNGADTVSNCEVLCQNCHKSAASYDYTAGPLAF